MRALVTAFIKGEFDRHASVTAQRRGGEGGKRQRAVRRVTTALVSNVIQALTGMVLIPSNVESPAWLDGPGPWPAGEILAAPNGLIHLASFVQNRPYCLPPTPAFLTFTGLDYEFLATAPAPTLWLRFLSDLWPDDAASHCLLQEFMGYLLLPDTSQQKGLFLLGPKRSGKGTIARVTRRVVGTENVVSPTLSSLAEPFGLWPLLNKTVAIIPDARLTGRADQGPIVERLLSISGEDAITVDRKFLPPVTKQLLVRFVILSNELPRLGENSGALASRFLMLRFSRSWYGNEDLQLTNKLLLELSGILLWAVAGWERLRARAV